MALSEMKLPAEFDMPVEESFVESVHNSVVKHYFPDDGSWAQGHLSNFGDDTRVNINLGKTLELLAKTDVDPENYRNSVYSTSVMFLLALPMIMAKLKQTLPSKAEALNWNITKMDLSFYDLDQFRGFDKESGKPMLGASAFQLILHLKPIPGKVPVSAAAKPKYKAKPKQEDKTEDKAEDKTEDKGQKPNVKGTYAKAAGAAAGGGAGYHKGKK
jgi:hypothetical protein